MCNTEFDIECTGLTRVFGKRTALNDINIKARSGTVLALVGSNGAGKTTLLKILATLLLPSSGRALVCGEDVTGNHLRIKTLIGFVASEERSFYWRLTGRRNLEFFAALHGIHGTRSAQRIDWLLDTVGIGEYGDIRFREYSTGMKQALGIVRGMLHDPRVLLMDEPTRSLSPDMAKRACDFIRRQATEDGKTVLFASHNLSEVERIADEVAILHRGTIRAAGSVAELARKAGLPDGSGMESIFDHFTGKDIAP